MGALSENGQRSPEWTKKIKSTAVCNWYYILFVANCIIAGIALLFVIGVIPFMRIPKGMMIGQIFTTVISIAIALVNALFLYIMCDRALLKN
jgi:hypothetical protein